MRSNWDLCKVFIGAVLLLADLLSASPVLNAGKNGASSASYLVYVGTYTGPASKGIYVFRFDPSTGGATEPLLAAETKNPSFLAADPGGHFLYAVNEVSDYEGKKSGAVTAFSVGGEGTLKFLNQVPSQGVGPCHVSLDKAGRHVLVANYDSGSVAVFPVTKDGKLGEATASIQHVGHGADPQRQEAAHAHQIRTSPDNHFVIAADLGLDQLLIYKFDSKKGTLTPNNPPYAKVEDASGARHFAFTPDGHFLYVLEEMRSAVSAFAYDAASGTLSHLQTISNVPDDFRGTKEAAEIVVHPSGKFLYASNRGHDSIAVFAIAADGKLSNVEYARTEGKTPRGFALDPTGSYLLVGNQESNNIVIFRVDPKTGRLTVTGQPVHVPSPVSVEFVRVK
jgi:6-phosphogluconolactonase